MIDAGGGTTAYGAKPLTAARTRMVRYRRYLAIGARPAEGSNSTLWRPSACTDGGGASPNKKIQNFSVFCRGRFSSRRASGRGGAGCPSQIRPSVPHPLRFFPTLDAWPRPTTVACAIGTMTITTAAPSEWGIGSRLTS